MSNVIFFRTRFMKLTLSTMHIKKIEIMNDVWSIIPIKTKS